MAMPIPGRALRRKSRNPVWPILVTILAVALGVWGVKALVSGGSPKNLLLLGVDENKTRTDVMLLAHIDPGQGIVNVISLPRDTLVEIPCEGLKVCVTPDKLAHAHAYGGEKGPEVATKTVEKFLGIKVDGYARVDFDGFEKVIDTLGGVDILIDKNMDYDDPSANPPLHIHFKASKQPQHLNGKDALRYVRYRNDGQGDIGRTDRTRKFMLALMETMKKNGTVAKLPSLITQMAPYVATNIDSGAAVTLAKAAKSVQPSAIQLKMVEGEPFITKSGAWVWLADEKKLRALVSDYVTNPKPPAKDAAK
jgi:polyisoprenyl-teichoic acid--peptidoglycan teichoic acid transferase